MRIFDCFPFYNELDLLEVRLTELYEHVDHFVLVEGSTTFTDLPKPYYFEDNKGRFKPFLDKIIHIKVDDMPHSPDAWVNDRFQRNAINRGIVDADPTDIIMDSDLDELLRPETVMRLRMDEKNSIWGMRMPLFNFKFNYMMITADFYSVWGMACRKRLMIPADEFRQQRFMLSQLPLNYNEDGVRIMEHAGWQFTYLGDINFAKNKIKSFAHTETNVPEIINPLDLEHSMQNGNGLIYHPEYRFSPVRLDNYFPMTVFNNQEKYAHRIIPNVEKTVWDFLPQVG